MELAITHLDDELRVPAGPVNVALATVGLALVLATASQLDMPTQVEMQVLGLLCFGLAGASWLLHSWNAGAGQWSTVSASVLLIVLAARWLRIPGLLSLLGIPTALAAAMIGLPGAAALASAETVLLALTPGTIAPGTSWSTVSVALVAIWAMLGLMAAVYRPIYQRAQWLERCTEEAQYALKEARDRKEELAQTRVDWLNASRQIRLANERLASLRLIAEEANRSKAAFVANVSHEFRTPLNIITGLIKVLVETPEAYGGNFPPKALDYLQIVYRNSQHLVSMIDDVLDLSQIEAGRMALHPEWTDLRDIIRSASGAIQLLIEEKGLSFRVSVPEELPRVYCDGIRIRQVILNLLSNAARLTEQGSIAVDVVQRNGSVVLSVADTGPGIPPEAADKIFEPFSNTSTQVWRDKTGSGLGLSISRQFIQLHGGHMRLDSEPGAGTTFFVELPIKGPQEHLTRPYWRIREDWIWRERSVRSQRAGLADQVLEPRVVVCDETADLYRAFARYSDGLQHIGVGSLPQALRELQECPAQALVINAAAPEDLWPMMDTARQESPDTPVVGCCCPPPLEHALKAGAIGYLTKPISSNGLSAALAQNGQPIRRILVVDDEAEVRELLTLFLHAYDETLEVLTAESGERALAEMRDGQPDLVLLDVLMPGMNGWDILAAAQADDTLSDIPVLMISGQDPREGPVRSKILVATMGDGISLSKLLDCSRDLSMRLLQPD